MPEYGNKIIFAGMACILAAGIVEINCNNCYFYCMLAIVSCYMDKEKDILKKVNRRKIYERMEGKKKRVVYTR